ncbi:uncharacterized protein LOC135086430 [Ostrinia nubilalis]|uniref:uncharacterized protein LOC135086430 n=1 Tax=Ostrinia nubilalis TaxID=29057 RepID=UPI003082663A
MLETEDIDDDYFTPASSTSLANIFGKTRKEDGTENESLKYTPPKPAKPEEIKTTQCLFACVLIGYDWQNGAYVARGKLGFAIIKIIKSGFHNIVLYDSNKTTLSCATISSAFEITVKENVYFSYHDNGQKYWSLYASENEMKKIIDLLKSFSAKIKFSSGEEKELPQPSNLSVVTDKESSEPSNQHVLNEVILNTHAEEKESDTDSSINRRTKMSILNRMANMGQSVLPPRTISTERTSDSSDTNDTSTNHKAVRHKPVKSIMKRNSSDKNLPECQSVIETGHINMEQATNSVPLFTYVNGQLVPVTNSNIISCNSSGNDMSFFISEQRVSNSEIRINMTRMSDKVDQILGKLSFIEDKDKNNTTSNFQAEVLQKLLSEYENKIRMYEEFIKSKDLNNSSSSPFMGLIPKQDVPKVDEINIQKIQHLEQINKEKEEKIIQLEFQCKALQNENILHIEEMKNKVKLTEEISKLKQELSSKNEEQSKRIRKNEECSEIEDNMGEKIKNIMNDTFRSISANFENDVEYSGERIKAITASIIKKVTIEALNKL